MTSAWDGGKVKTVFQMVFLMNTIVKTEKY
nr:MAG TPA: hypothetical protein [Crassvirales sp.]